MKKLAYLIVMVVFFKSEYVQVLKCINNTNAENNRVPTSVNCTDEQVFCQVCFLFI